MKPGAILIIGMPTAEIVYIEGIEESVIIVSEYLDKQLVLWVETVEHDLGRGHLERKLGLEYK